jgi:hypothetical protein
MSANFIKYVNSYTFDTVLPGSGEKVIFRPVTTGQLKKVLIFESSRDPDIMEKALDSIINECVITPEGFDADKLYLQDRFYLLLEIRKATKGSKYTFQTKCPSCSSQSQQNINLGNLPVVRLDHADKPKAAKRSPKIREVKDDETIQTNVQSNNWNVVELDKNISVRLSFVTREMQRTAMDTVTAMKDLSDTQKSVELSTLLFALSIMEIITPDGVDKDLLLEDRQYLIDNVSQDTLEKISDWYTKHDFGVKFSFDTKCIQCGYTENKVIPLESFFF